MIRKGKTAKQFISCLTIACEMAENDAAKYASSRPAETFAAALAGALQSIGVDIKTTGRVMDVIRLVPGAGKRPAADVAEAMARC